jgi:hypothetical protein
MIGLLAVGVAIALVTSIGAFSAASETRSNDIRGQDEEIMELLVEMKSMMATLNERMDTMIEKMNTMTENMDMMMNMIMGDMMGGGMMPDDMMNQEPQDVVIKIRSSPKVDVGKEAEIILLVLDKKTEEPLGGLEVLIGIERGSSMSTMEMMGDMFPAEDKGSGEYAVRFIPDVKGVYTIHTMVTLPRKSMMDNHMDFGIIAE